MTQSNFSSRRKGPYQEKLSTSNKQRYVEQIAEINNINPYNRPAAELRKDLDVLPPLKYPDILNDLFTLQEFKNFKSLEAHQQFCSGWVIGQCDANLAWKTGFKPRWQGCRQRENEITHQIGHFFSVSVIYLFLLFIRPCIEPQWASLDCVDHP